MKKMLLLLIILFISIITTSCVAYEPEIKNLIIMIGDGMSDDMSSYARYYLNDTLAWDDFSVQGQISTNSLSYPSPTDSAAAATAYATGIKTENYVVGMDANLNPHQNIMELAYEHGLSTGILTSDVLSDATPAAYSAHVANRRFYQEIIMAQATSNIDLLIGVESSSDTLENTFFGNANLFIENGYDYIHDDITSLSLDSEKILATFSRMYSNYRPNIKDPTLSELTSFALSYLSLDDDGFILMVENGQIDKSAHKNDSQAVLYEMLAFNDAVKTAKTFAKNRSDTAIIVCADHDTGGFHFDPALAIDDEDPFYLNSLSWETTGHTNKPINYYVYTRFDQYINHREIIDNTDIYDISRALINH